MYILLENLGGDMEGMMRASLVHMLKFKVFIGHVGVCGLDYIWSSEEKSGFS
jgi:hypothetical protein